MPIDCENNCGRKAAMKRPKTAQALCQDCFFSAFEAEVHTTITKGKLFKPGDFVAVAASGGKDSTVLAYLMKLLNTRHDYGLKLVLLSIDEGITGYRDDSLETVKRNEKQYQLPLTILSYKDLYGWTMDDIVRAVGRKNNCTFCGVFRRQALDRGAMLLGVNKIVTGHNADDVAETILMNLLRGDVARLQRCTAITTGGDGALPRCKPFKYTYEKEIVMYAYYKKLDYFSTECKYSPNAYRGHVRTLIKDLERIRPESIVDIIFSGESLSIKEGVKMPTQGVCQKCNYISSQAICKACVMLEGLNKGLPKLGIGKSSKVKGQLKSLNEGEECSSSGCASKKASGGCCGRSSGGCGQAQEGEEKKKGRRSSQKVKKLRRNRSDSSTIIDGDGDNDKMNDDAEDEGLGDFFGGCGGFSNDSVLSSFGVGVAASEEDNLYYDDDEVGAVATKMATASITPDDIENLGNLASTMLHMSGRSRSAV